MKKIFLVLLVSLPFLFSSCKVVLDVIAFSLERSANKPNVDYRWERTCGGVRISGTLTNEGMNTVTRTSIKVHITSENDETDYDWIEVSENIPTGSCVRFCETVYTRLDNISDVYCTVGTYD